MKRNLIVLLAATAALVFAGCSTVASRVAAHQADFATWPPAVQQEVRAGRIGIGFTPEQVQVALGKPDGVFSRTDVHGSFQVWNYRSHRPRIGIGIGVGSFNGSTAVGTGFNVVSGYRGERLRVVFDQTGHVTRIEQFRR